VITVIKAPPFATVQDLGRFGYRSSAVPPSGAMDPEALTHANRQVGNHPGAAAVEWGIGAGRLRLSRGVEFAIAGADTIAYREGEELIIDGFRAGAWAYLAVRGGVDVPEVLGSRSTYLPGRFGGFGGRQLRAGDVLNIGAQRNDHGGSEWPPVPAAGGAGPVTVVPGPDRWMLDDAGWEEFLATEWIVSRAVSRMGYRLEGPALRVEPPADAPSAPLCPGTVQLPAGGRPIVLMPDGPTVGGYPRVAVVLSGELGRLAQRRPGERVRFAPR
jgi:biotin-dependent carboxylase-like uncharacterized protein